MKFDTKRLFYDIAQKFKDNEYSISTVSEIITTLRENKDEITDLEAEKLLEIPINILKNDVDIQDEKNWANDNASYFGSNVTWVDSNFQEKWKNKFYSKNFQLSDVIELTEIVKNNFKKYRDASEFLLRNAEVTLRDDVVLKSHSSFKRHGDFFYEEIKNLINSNK